MNIWDRVRGDGDGVRRHRVRGDADGVRGDSWTLEMTPFSSVCTRMLLHQKVPQPRPQQTRLRPKRFTEYWQDREATPPSGTLNEDTDKNCPPAAQRTKVTDTFTHSVWGCVEFLNCMNSSYLDLWRCRRWITGNMKNHRDTKWQQVQKKRKKTKQQQRHKEENSNKDTELNDNKEVDAENSQQTNFMCVSWRHRCVLWCQQCAPHLTAWRGRRWGSAVLARRRPSCECVFIVQLEDDSVSLWRGRGCLGGRHWGRGQRYTEVLCLSVKFWMSAVFLSSTAPTCTVVSNSAKSCSVCPQQPGPGLCSDTGLTQWRDRWV